MKVSQLKARIRVLEVTVPGDESQSIPDEVVSVTYSPGALTLELFDRMRMAMSTGLDADVAYVMMKDVLVDWDLEEDILGDDGETVIRTQKLPCDERGIKMVPLEFLGLVMGALQEETIPNQLRDATSNGGSQQTALSEASPTGTSSSEPQTVSDAAPGSS